MRTRPRLHSRILYFMAAFIASGTLAMFLARALFAPAAGPQAHGADAFESGPQVGAKVPGPFHPFNVNGKAAGDEDCLFCRYGDAPVVMAFAKEMSPPVAVLVRRLEKAAADVAGSGEVGVCLIVTQNDEATRTALAKLADAENLKRVVLAAIESRYLKKYQLHADAEATVLLYSKQVVRANRAAKTGDWTEARANDIGDEAAKFLKSDR